jgi:hypothetical protein
MYEYKGYLIEEHQANERLKDIFIYTKDGHFINRLSLRMDDYKKHLQHFLNQIIQDYINYKKLVGIR